MKISVKLTFNNIKSLVYKIVGNSKKIPWILGKNAFLFILIFVLFDIIVGECLFYQYVFLVDIQDAHTALVPTKFQKNMYESVLVEWKKRDLLFNKNTVDSYLNPFLQ